MRAVAASRCGMDGVHHGGANAWITARRARRLWRSRSRLSTLLALVLLTSCADAPPPGRWNLLVLAPDTVRADHLSINGYARQTSPHIDALAREGANFSQAITVAPRTWQSFTSILTGRYPPNHGVRFISSPSVCFHPLPEWRWTSGLFRKVTVRVS